MIRTLCGLHRFTLSYHPLTHTLRPQGSCKTQTHISGPSVVVHPSLMCPSPISCFPHVFYWVPSGHKSVFFFIDVSPKFFWVALSHLLSELSHYSVSDIRPSKNSSSFKRTRLITTLLFTTHRHNHRGHSHRL